MADSLDIEGVKILGRAEWRATAESPKPDVSFLPMMERRRLTALERAALHVAWKVFHAEEGELPSVSEVPVVFASRWGEIGTTFKLMRQMHDEGEMSPAGFSSSVHNAAPGAWSLFTKNRAPYTAIAARDRSREMVLLEAKAYGLPSVAFDCECGPRELIRDCEDGILAPEGDVQALAAALQRLIDDPSLLARMGAAARMSADKWDLNTIMAKWTSLFEEIL